MLQTIVSFVYMHITSMLVKNVLTNTYVLTHTKKLLTNTN